MSNDMPGEIARSPVYAASASNSLSRFGNPHIFNPFVSIYRSLDTDWEGHDEHFRDQTLGQRLGSVLATLTGSWRRMVASSYPASRSGVLDYLTVLPVIYQGLRHLQAYSQYAAVRGLARVGMVALVVPVVLLAVVNLAIAVALTAVLTPFVALIHFGVWCKNQWDKKHPALPPTPVEIADDYAPEQEEAGFCAHKRRGSVSYLARVMRAEEAAGNRLPVFGEGDDGQGQYYAAPFDVRGVRPSGDLPPAAPYVPLTLK